MLVDLKSKLQSHLEKSLRSAYPAINNLSVDIENPADKQFGDFSTNVALKSAKVLRQSPLVIAEEFKQTIENSLFASDLKDVIAKVEIKNPGFINFFISQDSVFTILETVLKQKDKYGEASYGAGEKIQIEFVSANPTGPLSVAHARQAAVGDALGNILKFLGFDITKEYYVNDGGNQINMLGKSICCRAFEILGENIPFPEDGYQGEYIKDMAKIFMTENNVKTVDDLKKLPDLRFSQFGCNYLLAVNKKELSDFGVHFDVWSHESNVSNKEEVAKVLAWLKDKGHIYEKDGAWWFKSTAFGDDKDRVVKKSDGSFTYLAPDIVYHKNKFERGFKRVFNIWGPDHHGYIPRIKAAAQALGKDSDSIEVLIVQLATIFRNGQEVSMSTRKGQFISLQEVMDEVGVDAARFFFMMRHIEAHLEFDLELAKKQSPENPVYYVQYGHARVYSINEKARQVGVQGKTEGFKLLVKEEEIDLIKKLGSFAQSLQFCSDQLDPFALVSYLQELAAAFHKFYDQCRIIDEANKELSAERIGLSNAARIVFANGLKLLGISHPEKM